MTFEEEIDSLRSQLQAEQKRREEAGHADHWRMCPVCQNFTVDRIEQAKRIQELESELGTMRKACERALQLLTTDEFDDEEAAEDTVAGLRKVLNKP